MSVVAFFRLFIPFLFLSNAFSFDCSHKKGIEDELLKLELSGAHQVKKSRCLTQEQFKKIKAVHAPPSEKNKVAKEFVKDFKDIQVVRREKVEADTFEVKLKVKTVSGKEIEDKVRYVLYSQPRVQKIQGCGAILQPMETPLLFAHCR